MRLKFLIVMGVSGSGKTTIGKALAEQLGWEFFDADDFHPKSNIEKMSMGIPLTDADRGPWLTSLRELIVTNLKQDRSGVLACSALKGEYRRILVDNDLRIKVIYLKGSFTQILSRMTNRAGHFMSPKMLKSQFDALEEPEDAFIVDISDPVRAIVENILADLFGI